MRPLAQLAASAADLDGTWVNRSVNVAGDQLEIHRVRSALDQALARLRESHEALDLYVSNVSHELQDPVTTVLVEAQTMKAGAQSLEALEGFARSTRDELIRIGKIISGSLTLARLDSARQYGTLDPISILDIALDVVKQAHARALEHDVRLVLMLPESEELDVRGDAELVTSMLENVVSNAVAYSPPGEEIRIHLERAEEALRITVRDRGPGVPTLLLPHVLRAHVHGSRRSHGARGKGLGLAIATRVAHYHGGAIQIANHVDGGCEVVIALPLHRPRAHEPAREHSSMSIATA
jgi:signal transduction histidine kinase